MSGIPAPPVAERKAVELKLTVIALNRSKNHIGERTTD